MAHNKQMELKPRKTPVQARSAITAEAISEATIQILLSHGTDRLTTTLVAERAGISVGTLYQYYPNRQSLLFSLLKLHLGHVSAAVASSCVRARYKPLNEMIKAVVEAFVDAKMQRTDISTALYQIAAQIGGPALVEQTGRHCRQALQEMFRTAPDRIVRQEEFAVHMLYAAMAGATRTVLEEGAPSAMVRQVREHLVLLCQSYLTVVAEPRYRHSE